MAESKMEDESKMAEISKMEDEFVMNRLDISCTAPASKHCGVILPTTVVTIPCIFFPVQTENTAATSCRVACLGVVITKDVEVGRTNTGEASILLSYML